MLGKDIAVSWPQDELVAGYASAKDNAILEPHARTLYTDLLPALRTLVATNMETLSGSCTTIDSKCASSLAEGFASRAWRRDVSQTEKAKLTTLFDGLSQAFEDPKEAASHMLLAILSSPHFLYRSEMGEGPAEGSARRLSSREVGSALSFFFLGQPPDPTLLEKISRDGLKDASQINAEIDRLIADPNHAEWMTRFFTQWTHIKDLAKTDHSATVYPDATSAFKQEAEDAFEEQMAAMVESGGSFKDLLGSRLYYAGPLTAKAYARSKKLDKPGPIEAEGDRRGIFMSVAFLSQYSKPDRPNALARAKFFADQVLCLDLPGIPADALAREYTPDPNKSPRQNFEAFTSSSACSGCHRMMNPLGFSFDKYGADGQVQTRLAGFPIDTQANVLGSGELDGQYANPDEIVAKMATASQTRNCFLRQWFRFANGRKEDSLDECTVERLLAAMADGDDNLMAFSRNYFTSRNFLYREQRETK